jgi:metal-responsive CopG/Arc/MetJ family transcriptional regulator
MQQKITVEKKRLKGKSLQVRLTEPIYNAVERAAMKKGISRSTLARLAIIQLLIENEEVC